MRLFYGVLLLDHARPIPGGPSFLDPSGYLVRAKSISELLAAIASYRKNNGLPAGNPAREVETRFAVDYPWLISNTGTTPEVIQDPVARWLNRAWKSPIKDWAESETVIARLNTCLACEHYAPDHPFDGDSKRRLIILGAGRLKEAGACKVHHWACGLAILDRTPGVVTGVEGCWAEESSALST